MIIKYITDDGITVVEEKIDYAEFHAYTLDGEEKPSVLCRRSKNNKRYRVNYDDPFSNYFGVGVNEILTITEGEGSLRIRCPKCESDETKKLDENHRLCLNCNLDFYFKNDN